MIATSEADAILIDVTRDFPRQARALERVDLVLLTHAHRDASGGIALLDRWLAARATGSALHAPEPAPRPQVLASRGTIAALRARHRRLAHLELRAVASGKPLAWRGWRIAPLAVPHARDCTTFAWRLDRGGRSIVYASDLARLTPSLEALCAGCDLLVLDGAMWRRRIFSHLEIQAAVPIVARWRVRRVLLTQIGKSTPAHERLDRWLRELDPRFGAAYDGLACQL